MSENRPQQHVQSADVASTGAAAEARLARLVQMSLPENRNAWALAAKRQGSRVVGVLDSYVPEEIFHAARIVPYRVLGTESAETPLAEGWRLPDMCRFTNHVLEAVLSGQVRFLDGMVFTDWDDDERRLYDVCAHVKTLPFNYILHVSRTDTPRAYDYSTMLLRRLIEALKQQWNVNISDQAIWDAIALCDRARVLQRELYDLRRREVPPVSGAEALGIIMASFYMPRDEYVAELEALMPYLAGRAAPLRNLSPRLLVVSDHLDFPRYLEIVENEGCVVAMDDLDTGSRHFWNTVGECNGDPVHALARRYLTRPPDPRMAFWDRQVDQVITWANQWDIDGILHLPSLGGFERLCCGPYFSRRLEEAGVPFRTFVREYHVANTGQLRTQVGAFLESLDY
ncbi:MAG: 2-hydroxyacyl-CoA dehydratase family protein [Rhodoferax sp.]|uniref:2-hydroxyacyl-CoA dehydratase subunit D n=1 Tax=Rhodoferax sp. TaxID=50421 RepID=UPI00261E7100|nr:2-hydroxyacyl-CoA dehydratase family protein [Rhodoferax sp.]MDD5335392.1 2-hydroxyacyl-CoA dehydratase family protein [Rhodoferax sp.]